MEQGSPPSPRTRESMLGSAFTAVKNYFTPERNPSRPSEGLGITPLVRNFASLTLDDSTSDTTDSFRTCSSTPERNEISFQVPQHNVVETVSPKESAENPDDTIGQGESLDDSHQSEWSFISDPGEVSVPEVIPAVPLQLANNFLTPIKEDVEGSFCSEVSVSPNQTIITQLSPKSDEKITRHADQLLDSSVKPENSEVPTEVYQHLASAGIEASLLETSEHEIEQEGDLPDEKHKPEAVPSIDKPEAVSSTDGNPAEEVPKIEIVAESLCFEAPGDPIQTTITEPVLKPDGQVSKLTDHLMDTSLTLLDNGSPVQAPQYAADQTYSAAFEAFLSNSQRENPDDKIEELNFETDSLDGMPLSEPVLSNADVSSVEDLQKSVNVSTPIHEVPEASGQSNQTITVSSPPKSDMKTAISENDLTESSSIIPESQKDCSQVFQSADASFSADIEEILSQEFPENSDKIQPEETMQTDSLDSSKLETIPDVYVEENPVEQRQIHVNNFLAPIQEVLEGSLCSEISVNPNQTIDDHVMDWSLITPENNESFSHFHVPDHVEFVAATAEEAEKVPEPLDGSVQAESSVYEPEVALNAGSEENRAQQNAVDFLTPIQEVLCSEVAVNCDQAITALSSDSQMNLEQNLETDKEMESTPGPEESSSVGATLQSVDAEVAENPIQAIINEEQNLENDGKPESLPLSEDTLTSDAKEKTPDLLQAPIQAELEGTVCSEIAENPNQTITSVSGSQIYQEPIPELDGNLECTMPLPDPEEASSIDMKEKTPELLQDKPLIPAEREGTACSEIQKQIAEPDAKLECTLPLPEPEEASTIDTKEKTPEQRENEAFESSMCSEASVSPNPMMSSSIAPKSDSDISKPDNQSMDSPSNGLIISKGKIMVESTPQPAGIARRIANDNMSDVSPIIVCLPEEPASGTDSPYTKCFLDEAMIQSTPETIFEKSENVHDIIPSEKLAGRGTATGWDFLEQGSRTCLNSALNETKTVIESETIPNSAMNETKILHTPIINESRTFPSPALNETKTLSSVTNESDTLPNSAMNETKTLHTSVINDSRTFPSPALNETKTLSSVTNESETVPNSALNETKTLHTSIVNETQTVPTSALDETKILDFRFDETRTLFNNPEMNSTVTLVHNLDHTVSLAKAVDKANMNVTRILMNDDINNSLIAAVSPFNCKNISSKAASPANEGTLLFAEFNDEPRENWNASIVNKNKNPGSGVLREINDNVLDDMGNWFSQKANSPDKMNLLPKNTFPPISNFEMFNTKIQPSAINRESFFINFDPCYQPKGLLDSSCVNSTVTNKAAALDLMGLEMSTETNEEKMQKEIDRLRALYNEREGEAQLKFQEIQNKSDALEKQYAEASNTLDAIEERNSKLQRELQHLGKSNLKLAYASETYQKTVEHLRTDLSERLEMERPANPTALAAERDSYQQHLKSAEAAFIDVLTKYEKMRKSVLDLKKSVAQREKEAADLRRECNRVDELLRVVETTTRTSLEELQRKGREEQEQYHSDVTRITAQLRKSELSLKHIQDGYDKTVAENEKIAALCDDIIAGKS